MSTPTLAPSAGDFDDFREWEIEFNPSLRPPIGGPRLPHHPSRAEERRDASAQIDEGLAEWQRTHEWRS